MLASLLNHVPLLPVLRREFAGYGASTFRADLLAGITVAEVEAHG